MNDKKSEADAKPWENTVSLNMMTILRRMLQVIISKHKSVQTTIYSRCSILSILTKDLHNFARRKYTDLMVESGSFSKDKKSFIEKP